MSYMIAQKGKGSTCHEIFNGKGEQHGRRGAGENKIALKYLSP
jgi:hypothetical protein